MCRDEGQQAERATRKIAQLTKVVYHLNSRNEEHEQVLAALKAAHEREMDLVTTDLRQRMQHLEAMLGSSVTMEAHTATVAVLRDQYTRDKNEAADACNKHVRQSEADVVQVKEQVASIVSSKTTELRDMRVAFEQAMQQKASTIRQLELQLHKARAESSQYTSEMRAHHEAALLALHTEYQGQLEAARATLKADFDVTLRHREAQSQEDLRDCMAKHREALAQREAELAADWQNRLHNATAMAGTTEQLLRARIDELQRQLSMGSNEASATIQRLERDVHTHQQHLQESRAQCAAEADARTQVQLKAGTLESLAAKLQLDLTAAVERGEQHRRDTDDVKSRLTLLQAQLEHGVGEQARMQARIDQLVSEAQRVSSTAETLSSAKHVVESQLTEARAQFDDERRRMLLQFKAEMEALGVRHAEEKRSMASTNESDKASLIQGYQARLAEAATAAAKSSDENFAVGFFLPLIGNLSLRGTAGSA